MNSVCVEGQTLAMPTREDIENLKVGDFAPYSLGAGEVVEISFRGENQIGRKFVGYYVRFGESGGSMSHTLVEGQIEWPIRDQHSYAERCMIRSQFEPGPLHDHYGKRIDCHGRRI
jgi:hypothetical protein